MMQTDTIDAPKLEVGQALCCCRITHTVSWPSCMTFVEKGLNRDKNRTPQTCPLPGGPIWLGHDQNVQERFWNRYCFFVRLREQRTEKKDIISRLGVC